MTRARYAGAPNASETIRMSHSPIDRAQAKRVWEELRLGVSYLTRLRARMVEVGFLPTDPLFVAVAKAQEASQDLLTKVHYLTCDGGVGDPLQEQ